VEERDETVWTANQINTSFGERLNAGKGLLTKAPKLRFAHRVVDSWPLQEMSCVDSTKNCELLHFSRAVADEPRGKRHHR
jgi:hypothetical protein